MSAAERIRDWQQRGGLVPIGNHEIFVVDVPPAPASSSTGSDTPLLVLHGFPTSSIDFDAVLPVWPPGGGSSCSTSWGSACPRSRTTGTRCSPRPT